MAELSGKLLKIYNNSIKKLELTALSSDVLCDTILFFADNDPSGTFKYTQHMVNMMLDEIGISQDGIVDLIKRFHNIENKLSSKIFTNIEDGVKSQIPESILLNPKDIQNYQTYKHFDLVYKIAVSYDTKKDKKNKIVDEETDIVYDEDDYQIVVPLTFESSCYWGVETKWCTTSRDNPHYFKDYENRGTIFYIIDKYRQNEKSHPLSKFAIFVNHNNSDSGAEIFNRPDAPMGTGMERILPARIILKLMTYHRNGGICSKDVVYRKFNKYKNSVESLNLPDNWIKSQSSKDIDKIVFECEKFPSYCFVFTFIFTENSQESALYVKLKSQLNGYIISELPEKRINNKTLSKVLKSDEFFSWCDNTINNMFDDKTYTTIKHTLLKFIVTTEISKPHNGWRFDHERIVYNKRNMLTPFTGQIPPLTDLGNFYIKVKGDFYDLTKFEVTASLDFYSNTFIIHDGQTDIITWDKCFKDFNLLYYDEIGLSGLIIDLKEWIIITLRTKSEKIIDDIYNDNASKALSKSFSFEDYLKSTENPSTKKFPEKNKKLYIKSKMKTSKD